MSALSVVFAVSSCALSAACGYGTFSLVAQRRARIRRRRKALGTVSGEAVESWASRDLKGLGLRYAESLTRGFYTGAAEPISPLVSTRQAEKTRSGKRFLEQAKSAGCEKDVSVSAFCEAELRFGLVGAAVGGLLGAVFSIELAAVLGVVGLAIGYSLPTQSLKTARKRRAVDAEQHLSEMLEVVALGLRSGLSFDLSFALYASHFEGGFAQECGRAYRRWALGLMTREESLHQLAQSYECEQLRRVIDSILRSLRLGTSLTGVLEDAASQSRATYRAALEERVAKAPVKMMLPTGTLILPAMLLMVMGPVLLELAGGF